MSKEGSYGSTYFIPIRYNKELCIGCNRCVESCQVDVLLPNGIKGESPVVGFPEECWYCGSCVTACPIEGAIELKHPLMNQARWVDKSELIKGEADGYNKA